MALDFFAGCLGGCAGILVGHPFDTVKVHLQTQDFRNPKYRGTFHCFQTIIKTETARGLYRGMSSPLAAVAAVNAIVFGVYGNAQRRMRDPDSLCSHMTAGAAAGLVQSFVCSPIELAKTRVQLQGGGGALSCLLEVARAGGVRALYRGLGPTVAREVPGYGIYFLAYEAMTRRVDHLRTHHMLLAGGLSGVASWLASYPADVVKSRLQADLDGRYSGAADCLRKSVASEGLAVFTRGLVSTLLRAFPTNAATFTVVTWVMRCAPRDQPAAAAAAYHTPLRGGEFVTLGGGPQLDVSPAWREALSCFAAPHPGRHPSYNGHVVSSGGVSRATEVEEEVLAAILGRDYSADEDCPGGHPAVVPSQNQSCYWVCSEPRVPQASAEGPAIFDAAFAKYVPRSRVSSECE